MKTIKTKGFLFLLLILLFGCGEKYVITTKIFSDGSCIRTLQVTSDRQDFDSTKFPITIDSTWNIEIEADTTDSTNQYKYIAIKKYANVNEANNDLKGDNRYSKISRKIEFKKQFRWFNTYYKYEETYGRLFNQFPIDSFLMEDEIAIVHSEKADTLRMFSNLDSNEVKMRIEAAEDKYWKWIQASMFEEYFNIIKLKVSELSDSLLMNDLCQNKDSVFNFWIKTESDIDTVIDHFDLLLNAEGRILSFKKSNDSLFIKLEERVESWEELYTNDNVTNEIIMPGELVKTNSENISNDTVRFDILWENYFSEDYKMEVVSKITNRWATYATIAIFILIIIAVRFIIKK